MAAVMNTFFLRVLVCLCIASFAYFHYYNHSVWVCCCRLEMSVSTKKAIIIAELAFNRILESFEQSIMIYIVVAKYHQLFNSLSNLNGFRRRRNRLTNQPSNQPIHASNSHLFHNIDTFATTNCFSISIKFFNANIFSTHKIPKICNDFYVVVTKNQWRKHESRSTKMEEQKKKCTVAMYHFKAFEFVCVDSCKRVSQSWMASPLIPTYGRI